MTICFSVNVWLDGTHILVVHDFTVVSNLTLFQSHDDDERTCKLDLRLVNVIQRVRDVGMTLYKL